METDSGSEGLDIALFSKKFKVSQEKLNELELKTKTKKNKMKAKDKVKDSNSNSSNRTKDKYELLDRANDDKLDENTENSSVKFQEKPIKRKHKHSEKLDSENVSSPLRKTKYKSENNDNVVEEDGLSPKKRKKTEKEHRSSVINRSLRLPTSKKEQNKLNETIGTSSEESDLETDSFRRKVFNNRVKSKVNQKDIKEKVTKSLKDKNNAEAESDYSDDSERVIVASPSDSESSDGETDQGQESDAETSEMKPEKKLVLNKSNKKVIRQRKDAMSNATIQSNEAKLVKGNGKKKTEALERDSSSDSSTDTSDSKETDNESLESDSDNIRNSTDSEPSKVEKSGAKKLLRKGGKDVIPERKKRRKELPDVDEDNVTVDSVQEEDKDPYAAIKKELANIPLEDLVKIKDKLGLKVFSQILQGGKKADPNQKKVFKRENKNRPMEMSSKRPVPIIRQTYVPKKKVARDPRFDDLSGEYKEEYFERNYSFLQDVKAKEKEVIKKKLLKSKNDEKKEKLQYLLNRMNQQEQASQQKQRRKEIEMTVKQKEKQLVKEGKNPYFLKKAERKKLELAEKYKELQKSGKVDQYLSRKRQKNAHKEKKKLPGKHARR